MSYEDDIEGWTSDWDVANWEKERKKLGLFVCSTCGLIASDTISHSGCSLQDWWHLNVECRLPETSVSGEHNTGEGESVGKDVPANVDTLDKYNSSSPVQNPKVRYTKVNGVNFICKDVQLTHKEKKCTCPNNGEKCDYCMENDSNE